jgi:hypothetical protein
MRHLAGGLACAYGALIFASIDTSDTATRTLVALGLTRRREPNAP